MFIWMIFRFFSHNMKEHRRHVTLVLQQLLDNKLFVKAEKCDFHVTLVGFLGYIIEQRQVKPDPVKIRDVEEWPVPSTRK